jgi:hypothetical protein
MNYDSPPHDDVGDYPDSPSGEGRKVYSGFGEPGNINRVQDDPLPPLKQSSAAVMRPFLYSLPSSSL